MIVSECTYGFTPHVYTIVDSRLWENGENRC